MNLLTEVPSLSNKLVARFLEVAATHQECAFHPSSNMIDLESPQVLKAVRDGKFVNIIVKRGPLLVCSWVPALPFQFCLDAHGETI